jgi:hypothetical protein
MLRGHSQQYHLLLKHVIIERGTVHDPLPHYSTNHLQPHCTLDVAMVPSHLITLHPLGHSGLVHRLCNRVTAAGPRLPGTVLNELNEHSAAALQMPASASHERCQDAVIPTLLLDNACVTHAGCVQHHHICRLSSCTAYSCCLAYSVPAATVSPAACL